jgi:ElaB/YqjD/DUF883 family membrane-anchored ribosome-binding protein
MNASVSVNDVTERSPNGARRVGGDEDQVAGRVKRTVSSELSNLVQDVEDLLRKVANVADVDVARLRERVQEKLGTARDTLAAGGKRLTETARDAAGATDEYVHRSPWQALGFAALAGVAIGFLVARR